MIEILLIIFVWVMIFTAKGQDGKWRITDLLRRYSNIADAEKIDYEKEFSIAPCRHRFFDLTAGVVNIVVPTGEVWVITGIRCGAITAAQLFYISINSKLMFWCMADNVILVTEGVQPGQWFGVDEKYADIQKMMRPIVAVEGQIISVSSQDDTGDAVLEYRVIPAGKGTDSFSDGGFNAKTRTIHSVSHVVESVAIGATEDILMNVNWNPPGCTTFPFGTVVPPNREYELLIFYTQSTTTVGTNLLWDGIRVLHEGREILTPAGIVQAPAAIMEMAAVGNYGRLWIFPHGYLIRPFETVQVMMRVTSTDVGAQDATLNCGFIMNERFIQADR